MAAPSPLSLDGLTAAAHADRLPTTLVAALLGALFHQSIRTIEFDRLMYHSIALSIVSFIGLVYAYLSLGELGLVGATAKASLVATSFNIGLVVSIGIYRLFFHRLRSFPGPFWAKLSRFYATSLAAKNVQYYKEVKKLHEEYGDFVRTGRCPFPNCVLNYAPKISIDVCTHQGRENSSSCASPQSHSSTVPAPNAANRPGTAKPGTTPRNAPST
jgi:hypothetical protein